MREGTLLSRKGWINCMVAGLLNQFKGYTWSGIYRWGVVIIYGRGGGKGGGLLYFHMETYCLFGFYCGDEHDLSASDFRNSIDPPCRK